MYYNIDGIFTRYELLDYTSFPPETSTESFFYELASHTCKFETIVKLLESVNENLALQTLEGNTGLHVAAMNHCCKVEVIQLLIRKGANISAKNSSQKTALHLALENQEYNHDVIYELLRSGSPLQELDNHNNSPLLIAVENKICEPQVIKALISHGSDVNMKCPRTRRCFPLLRLFRNYECNVEAVKLLLDSGAKISDFSGDNLLHIYLYVGNCKVDIVQELIDRKEDVVATTQDQENLLHLTVKNNNCYKVLRHLLKTTSLDINGSNTAKETALHAAIKKRDSDKHVVSLLLAHGADVNFPNQFNRSPLHYALYNDFYNTSIVSILLDAGASVSMVDRDKVSPLGIIVRKFMVNPLYYKHCVWMLIRCAVKQSLENHKGSEYWLNSEALRATLCSDVKYYQYGCLSVFVDICHQELIEMKNQMLENHLSLFDILKSCRPRIDENIIRKVLEVFQRPCYPMYKHYIAVSLGRLKLLEVLYTLPFYSKSGRGDRTSFVKEVVLFPTCVDSVVRYLNTDELFDLCIAYHKPETADYLM